MRRWAGGARVRAWVALLALVACPLMGLVVAAGCGNSNGTTGADGGEDSGVECPDGDICSEDGSIIGSDDGGATCNHFCCGAFCQDATVTDSAPTDATNEAAPEAASDARTEAGTPPTSVVFVHASRDLPDLRFCFGGPSGSATTDPAFPSTGPAPQSNYAAIPVGGAAVMTNAASLVTLGPSLTVWAVDARAVATLEAAAGRALRCTELLAGKKKPHALPTSAYWTLTDHLTVLTQATVVVAITGCAAGDTDASAAACGGAAGNLGLQIAPLPSTAAPQGGQLSIEAIQLSPAAASAGTTAVAFGPAASPALAATLGAVGSTSGSAWIALPLGSPPGFAQLGFRLSPGSGPAVWMSLEQSLLLVNPTVDPSVYFGQPTSYLVAVLGDPHTPVAYGPDAGVTPDGTELHTLVVALPFPQ